MSARRRALVGTVRTMLRLLTHWEVRGWENLPAGGPLIVVFNHIAHLDGPLVIASLPWEVEIIALSDLYAVPITGWLLRLYGVIAVHRDEFDRDAVRRALEALSAGKVLALSPEARRSAGGTLEQGRAGVGYLALRSGAPLLPIGITGTEAVITTIKSLRRPRLTINIGPSFRPNGPLARGAARHLQWEAARHEIMTRIAALLPVAYRGYYA